MKKSAICFTESGKAVIRKLNEKAVLHGIEPIEAYICKENTDYEKDFIRLDCPLKEWTKDRFDEHSAIIFVSATGIAVRTVADFLNDKLKDSPVLVIDDMGRFVIPIISGHAGGANKLAVTLAGLIDAIPVITTATDGHGAFSADVFAAENGLRIVNREGIKKVSAKAIEGKAITLSVKDYPPKEEVDIIIADNADSEYSLLLSPPGYTVGIGMKKGVDSKYAREFILENLKDNDIDINDIYALGTIDIKENEPAIRDFCSAFSIPLITFEADMLKKAKGEFTSSAFVEGMVGVDNVCERAAVLAAGPGAKLIIKKHTGEGITFAVAKRF